MDKITFSQEYSFQPFSKMAIISFFSRPIIIFLYLFWGAFLLFGGYTDFIAGTGDLLSDGFVIYLFIFMAIFYPYSAYRNAIASYKALAQFRAEDGIFTINDQEIHFESEKYSLRMNWELIAAVRERKDWFYLKYNDRSGLYLYQGNMNPTDVAILRSIIKGRTDLPAKLKA